MPVNGFDLLWLMRRIGRQKSYENKIHGRMLVSTKRRYVTISGDRSSCNKQNTLFNVLYVGPYGRRIVFFIFYIKTMVWKQKSKRSCFVAIYTAVYKESPMSSSMTVYILKISQLLKKKPIFFFVCNNALCS